MVRFGGQTFGSPVRSSSGCRSMSVVSASLWHATGTVCSPPPVPVCSPSPGLVSPCVHTYEDQRDEHKNADHKPPIAREADVMDWPAAHYVAPTEELESGRDPQSHDTSQMPGVPSTGSPPVLPGGCQLEHGQVALDVGLSAWELDGDALAGQPRRCSKTWAFRPVTRSSFLVTHGWRLPRRSTPTRTGRHSATRSPSSATPCGRTGRRPSETHARGVNFGGHTPFVDLDS